MFLRHDECPSCGSSDNLAVYESREFPGYETSNCMTPGCAYKVTDFDIQKTNPNLAVAPMEKKSRISPKADVVLKGWENAQPAYEKGHGSKAVVDHFDIRFDAAKNKILYPIKTQTGELIAIKTRSLSEKAFATYYITDVDSPALFGLNTLSSKWQVLLTEGEKDATAVKEMLGSASVLSVRSANTALKDVRSIYPILVDLEADVFLCFDNDEAGAIATAEVSKAFPTFKVVSLPTGCKDAHEAFMKGLTKKFKDSIYAAEKQKPQCLESKSDVRAKAIERASRTASECMGWSTGIGQLDALIGGLREHELTLIFGGSGIGKSQSSRQITMSLLKQGIKTLVVTSEEGHDKWTCELARSRYGLSNQGDATNVIKFLDTYGDILDYMKVSGLNTKTIDEWLVKVKASMIAMQSKVLVFDNITHISDLISSASSWEITYKISLALSDFARDNDIHVIVVGHVLKMNNEIGDVPTIAKFKGGSSPNYFHNILGIFIPEDDTKLRNVVLVKRRETPIGLTTSLGDVVSMTYDPNFGNYVSEKSNGQPARTTDSAGMQALKASRKPIETISSDSASDQEPQPRLSSDDPQGESDNAGIEGGRKCDGNPVIELVGDVEVCKDSEDLARLPSTDRDDTESDEVNWGDFMPAIAI